MEEMKKVANEQFDWNAYENDLGVYNQPREEIAEAYDKTLSNVAVGEVVEGTVTGISKREVIVNIGYKSEGIVPISEFRYNPDLQVGDKVASGQTLVVLEAMKMENNIDADREGRVKEICVQQGATVMEGDNLIVIE